MENQDGSKENENLKINNDGSRELKLKFPVRWGESELIETITIKPPKAKHLKGMQVGVIPTHDQWVSLISKCSDRTLAQIDEMEAVDTFEAIEVMQHFLSYGPQTGKK